MNNNTTKRFPGNRSKKISKNVIITESDRKEEGSRRGKKGATRDKTFPTKEVKKESIKERENLKRTSTTTVDWMDCILVSRERD